MRVRRGISFAAAALALALVPAAPASAARTEVVTMPAFSPKLVTGGTVFFSRAPGRARVIRAVPGGGPAEIASLPDPPAADPFCCSQEYGTALAAEGGHAAASRRVLMYAKGAVAEDSFMLRAGPVTAPLPELYSCAGNHPFDVDGGRIAYLDGCINGGGPGSPVVVRDLTAPNAPIIHSIPVAGSTESVDLAGQHLAIGRIGAGNTFETIVRDLASDTEAYRAPGLAPSSLQADGKLVLRVGSGSGCRLDWYSKAEPVAHTIDICPSEGLKMAGDRIAIGREAADGKVTLDLLALDGQITTLATFGNGSLLNGIDFDGTRMVYAVGGCSTTQDKVYIDDLAGPAATEGGPCPGSIRSSKVRASSSGKVTVKFSCEEGCSGFLTLHRGGKQIVRSVDPLEEEPGTGRATMRLKSSNLKLLRSRGSLSVQARLQVQQRGGPARTFKRAIRLLEPK